MWEVHHQLNEFLDPNKCFSSHPSLSLSALKYTTIVITLKLTGTYKILLLKANAHICVCVCVKCTLHPCKQGYKLIYIYNNMWNLEKLKLEFQIRFQFCTMCPKLFILKEFYFLILESNVGLHHKYSSKWVIKYKNQMPICVCVCEMHLAPLQTRL